MAQTKPRYNPKEAAHILGITEQQIRRLCRAGKMGVRECGAWVIYRYEIAARLGASPRDVEQIRRFDIASRIGKDGLDSPAVCPPMPGAA